MSFRLARLDSGGDVPLVVEKPVDAAVTSFNEGALLVTDAQDEWVETGADPALVSAIALSGYGVGDVYSAHGRQEFPPGRVQGVAVQDGRIFSAEYIGSLPAAPGDYGVVKDSDGKWKVDFADAVNTRVHYIGTMGEAPLNTRRRVLVYFLTANVKRLP